jgi:ABC-type bacteriocin/lantibiotic exporter with double-glycine peptidase domain
MTEKKPISASARFVSLLRPDRKEIRNIYIFAIFSGLMSMALPLGIQAIINFIQMGQVSTSWFILVGLVVVAIGFSGFMNIAQLRITENLQQRIFARAAYEFADRIPKIKLIELVKQYAPELTNRFFDTLTIQKGLSKLLIDFTAATLQIIFGLVLLSFYHSFFIFFGLFLVLLLLLIFWLTAQKGFNSSLEESKYKYKIAHWLEEIAHSRVSFKLAGRNLLPIYKVESFLDNYLKARNTHFRVLVTQYALLIGFKVLIALSLLIVGGVLVLNQQMNIGQFVAAEIIIVLVLTSVEKMILSLEVVYDVLTAVEKIGQVTDLEMEHYEGRYIQDCSEKGLDVSIKELTYETEIYRSPILEDISFTIEPGEKVAFISDSSVSTNMLFCLIGGLYEPNRGSVVVNGIPIGNINLQKLRYDIGNMITQDKLFYGTIAQNISLGREKVPFEEIVRVSKLLKLNKYLDMFSDGYDTMVNPESHFVPKDVIQKILLARSIAGNPKLLLLENPTDALNREQVETVINAIVEQTHSTVLLDSLDDNIHKIADRIIKIEQGRIVFDGSYDNYKRHFN